VIPKDVDLTPAFERGGALVNIKKAGIYELRGKFLKTEI
jgi:hypothetical protein